MRSQPALARHREDRMCTDRAREAILQGDSVAATVTCQHSVLRPQRAARCPTQHDLGQLTKRASEMVVA